MRGGRQRRKAGDIECSIRPLRSLPAHWRTRSTVPIVESGASEATSSMTLSSTANLKTLHVSSQLSETLLERETRITVFLRRLFARHGNFSPERSRARVAPRTVAIVRDYLHAMVAKPGQHRRPRAGGRRLRYAGHPGLLSGNRHAAAFLPRQPAGRTGKGGVTSRNPSWPRRRWRWVSRIKVSLRATSSDSPE